MIREIKEKITNEELDYFCNKLKGKENKTGYVAFIFCIQNTKTEINKLYDLIIKESVKPELDELEKDGLLNIDKGIIRPTTLGMIVYKKLRNPI